MAKCPKCNVNIDNNIDFCSNCGANLKESANPQTKKIDVPDVSEEFDSQDIENNKTMALLSYLTILSLVPFFSAKNSKFASFHAKQGVTLLIFEIAYGIVESILGTILYSIMIPSYYSSLYSTSWGIYLLIRNILRLGYAFFAILSIIGIMNVLNKNAKKLPIIGNLFFK